MRPTRHVARQQWRQGLGGNRFYTHTLRGGPWIRPPQRIICSRHDPHSCLSFSIALVADLLYITHYSAVEDAGSAPMSQPIGVSMPGWWRRASPAVDNPGYPFVEHIPSNGGCALVPKPRILAASGHA